MKVKVIIHEFYDREGEKYRKLNETFEVKDDHGKKLIGLGLVEEVKTEKEPTNKASKRLFSCPNTTRL